MLIGIGALGLTLFLYKSTRSSVWRSIICLQGRASVSEASLYHPFKWRNASCASPFASSASIASPTLLVRSLRSFAKEAHIARFMLLLAAVVRRPDVRSIVICRTIFQVSSEIQLFCGLFFGSGSSQSTLSFSKLVVISSCGPNSSCTGKHCRCLR